MRHYDIIPIGAIIADPTIVPAFGGFYGIAPVDPVVMQTALDRAGLTMDAMGLGVLSFLYVGVGASLRDCLVPHLRNDSAGSRLRQSLGAILRDDLDLTVRHSAIGSLRFEPKSEKRLTDWMAASLQVAILRVDRPGQSERRVSGQGEQVVMQRGRRVHDNAWSQVLVRRKTIEDQNVVTDDWDLA